MKSIFNLKFFMFFISSLIVFCSFTFHEQNKKRDLPAGLYAEIQTEKGNILLFLEFQKVPLTVANFVGLAEGKIHNTARPDGVPYYDSLVFHRVVKDFVIQAGDPKGDGSGGPGYTFVNEYHSDLKHSGPGILAMANRGKDTNGSQFYITHKQTSQLDGKYSVFGKVVEGQEIVDAIEQGDRINHVEIIRVGKSAKKFNASKVFAEHEAKGEVVWDKK